MPTCITSEVDNDCWLPIVLAGLCRVCCDDEPNVIYPPCKEADWIEANWMAVGCLLSKQFSRRLLSRYEIRSRIIFIPYTICVILRNQYSYIRSLCTYITGIRLTHLHIVHVLCLRLRHMNRSIHHTWAV